MLWRRCGPAWEMRHSTRPGRGAGPSAAGTPCSTHYGKHDQTSPGQKACRRPEEPAPAEPGNPVSQRNNHGRRPGGYRKPETSRGRARAVPMWQICARQRVEAGAKEAARIRRSGVLPNEHLITVCGARRNALRSGSAYLKIPRPSSASKPTMRPRSWWLTRGTLPGCRAMIRSAVVVPPRPRGIGRAGCSPGCWAG